MKKFFILAMMALAVGMSANGQTVITNDYGSPITGTDVQKSGSDELEQSQGGFDVQYNAIENGWGIGIDYVVSNVLFGYDYLFGKTNDYVNTNNGMEIYLGGNYRYRIIENLYVEGRAMIGYYYWKTEFKGGGDDSANKVFLGFSPRVGLQFGKWAISAGYRWDYVDFKFDKEHCLDRFNIGLTFGL